MSIYKKMTGSNTSKSKVDNRRLLRYSDNSGMRLILAKTDLDEFRCGDCGVLLFKGHYLEKSFIEVKCRSCGTFNVNQ